jgi:hypothetical protein
MGEARRRRVAFGALLAAVVALAAAWRLVGVRDSWPINFHVMRQYQGAMVARTLWLWARPGEQTPSQRRWLEGKPAQFFEPPIVDALAAASYLAAGEERPWVGSLLSSCLWLAGGWFLYQAAKLVAADEFAALASLAVYLLAPLGVFVSRSFQPESLAVFGFLAALWYLLRGDPTATVRRSAAAGLVCGIALLAKPGSLALPLLGAYAALALQSRGPRALLRSLGTYLFLALALAPTLLYAAVLLRHRTGIFLMPHLWVTGFFYEGWAKKMGSAVVWIPQAAALGWVPLAAAVLGAVMMRRTPRRFLGCGLLAGYVGYSFLFPWHAATHDYYQAPLIPIVALGLAPLALALAKGQRWEGGPAWRNAAWVVGLVALAALYSYPARAVLGENGIKRQAYEAAGESLGRGSRVIYLGPNYGNPLFFHGWLTGNFWPNAFDKQFERLRTGKVLGAGARLERLLAAEHPAYFVVDDPEELERQPDLAELLRKRYPVCHEQAGLVVYDLRKG